MPQPSLLAVLVSAIVGMVIGALWYSPILFGKVWMNLSGFTDKKMQEMKKKGMAVPYILNFIFILILSYVLALFINASQAVTIMQGAIVGFFVWIGFMATLMLNSVLWEGKPVKLYILNIAYHLITVIIMSIILTVWK